MKIINDKKEAIEELKRISTRTNSDNNNRINKIVEEILQEVKFYGDIAVEKYTKKFDGFDPFPMQVKRDEIKNAWDELDNNLKHSLVAAHKRIQKFHEKEIPQSFTIKGEYGDTVQRRWRPVKKAGIYFPFFIPRRYHYNFFYSCYFCRYSIHQYCTWTVSYTHLTLPTKRIV